MAYIIIDETKRITAASKTYRCGDAEIEVEIPEEVWEKGIHNHRYENGEFVYDIPPVVASPVALSTEERIEALEAAVTMLCMPDVEV